MKVGEVLRRAERAAVAAAVVGTVAVAASGEIQPQPAQADDTVCLFDAKADPCPQLPKRGLGSQFEVRIPAFYLKAAPK